LQTIATDDPVYQSVRQSHGFTQLWCANG